MINRLLPEARPQDRKPLRIACQYVDRVMSSTMQCQNSGVPFIPVEKYDADAPFARGSPAWCFYVLLTFVVRFDSPCVCKNPKIMCLQPIVVLQKQHYPITAPSHSAAPQAYHDPVSHHSYTPWASLHGPPQPLLPNKDLSVVDTAIQKHAVCAQCFAPGSMSHRSQLTPCGGCSAFAFCSTKCSQQHRRRHSHASCTLSKLNVGAASSNRDGGNGTSDNANSPITGSKFAVGDILRIHSLQSEAGKRLNHSRCRVLSSLQKGRHR